MFPYKTSAEVLGQFSEISPRKYSASRNFLRGSVSRISPYVTHGIVTSAQLFDHTLAHSRLDDAESLLREIAWKEFFQSTILHHPELLVTDMEPDKTDISRARKLPRSLIEGKTGHPGVDAIVRELNTTGYIHNHARMWLASWCVHVARLDWKLLADWTYSRFLDGDLGPNHASWQWVQSTFSSKPYIFNAENAQKYSDTALVFPDLIGSYEEVEGFLWDKDRIPPLSDDIGVASELLRSDLSNISYVQSLPSGTLLLSPWDLGKIEIGAIVFFDEAYFRQHPWHSSRIEWVRGYAEFLGASVVRGSLVDIFATTKNLKTIESWRPIYSDIQKSHKDLLEIIPLETIHPGIRSRYFKRFFPYWESVPKG